MPITQARFIEVLEAADAILRSNSLLHELYRQSSRTITQANAVVDRSPDLIARSVMSELLALIHAMTSLVTEQAQQNAEFIGIIRAEKIHFDRKKRANDKAAYYQRQKRKRDRGELVEPLYQSPFSTEDLTDNDDPYSDVERNKAWYSGPNAPTPPPNYNPETGTFSTPIAAMAELSPEPLGGEQVATISNSSTPKPKRIMRDMVLCTTCQYEVERGAICLRCNPLPSPLSTPAAPNSSPEPLGEQVAQQETFRISADGTKRFLPSDEEINSTGQISSGTNLL